MGKSGTDAAEVSAEDAVQVNVRLRRPRLEIARRIAAAHGETLTAYLDRLLADDMDRESAALLQRFDEEEQAVRDARAAAIREINRR